MREGSRAADDVDTINARIKELELERLPRRRGSPANHCDHCPKAPEESCMMDCKSEAIAQGWYSEEIWG